MSGLSDQLLANALARITDYADAADQIEQVKGPAVSAIWALAANVKWGCGQEQPTRSEVVFWSEKTKKIVVRASNSNHGPYYADAVRFVKAVLDVWCSINNRRQPPWSGTTQYAMATAIDYIHHRRWVPNSKEFGGVNEMDFNTLLDEEGGFWNLYQRLREINKVQNHYDEIAFDQSAVANFVASIGAMVTAVPAVEPLREEANKLMLSVDARLQIAQEAMDAANSCVNWHDAERATKKAADAQRDADEFRNDAQRLLSRATQLEAEAKERARWAEQQAEAEAETGATQDTGGTCGTTAETDGGQHTDTEHTDTAEGEQHTDEHEVQGRTYAFGGGGHQTVPAEPTTGNDNAESVFDEAAFQKRANEAGAALLMLMEKLGITAKSTGSLNIDGIAFTYVHDAAHDVTAVSRNT